MVIKLTDTQLSKEVQDVEEQSEQKETITYISGGNINNLDRSKIATHGRIIDELNNCEYVKKSNGKFIKFTGTEVT